MLLNVIDAWSSYSTGHSSEDSDQADSYRLYFPQLRMRTIRNSLDTAKAHAGESAWDYLPQYIHATPIRIGKPELYPVVQFVVRKFDDRLDLSVRVATYYVGKDSPSSASLVMADGWRFEMPDVGIGAGDGFHHFPHVQRTTSWDAGKVVPSLGFHAPKIFDSINYPALDHSATNESRPAFPLPSRTPAGVVVCAMASLYGANATNRILLNYEGKPVSFRKELESIITIAQ